MKNKLIINFFKLFLTGFLIHALTFATVIAETKVNDRRQKSETKTPQQVKRAPAVEPIFELKNSNLGQGDYPHKGYNFNKTSAINNRQIKRAPANIVKKPHSQDRLSFLGPLIFFLTLPFCVWLIIDRKFIFKKENGEFQPPHTSVQEFGENNTSKKEEDHKDDDPNDKGNFHFPKAS